MYGLKQAAILAYTNLVQNLRAHGYHPIANTVGMWKHRTLPTLFCLCVDDFGIKYFEKAHTEHLLNALKTNYKISTDWEGKNYCGLTLDWHYKEGYVDVSMPGYIKKVLIRYKHPIPSTPV